MEQETTARDALAELFDTLVGRMYAYETYSKRMLEKHELAEAYEADIRRDELEKVIEIVQEQMNELEAGV
jgi:hypothetical protein